MNRPLTIECKVHFNIQAKGRKELHPGQAAAPLAFGLLIDAMGSRVLIVSSALSLAALLALCLLRKEPAAP